ncbi:MAG: patatin family protein [Deltaproteobacteria bacterium]|nr:MAG: patatin family protein [Deltaproteobacteria bacterium]
MKQQPKRALIVEGGGMRGSHSCGALMALVENGFWEFEVVAATSAGACTSAFLVSRQFDMLPKIWTEHLHGTRFINYRNLTRRSSSLMDLDYLIDQVFANTAPLNTQAIQESSTQFYIVATHCKTGKPKYFEGHTDPILPALKASAALPIAYRQPVIIENDSYIDGGLSDAIPIQKAIEEGCEEIFVLLTRPKGYRKKSPLIDLMPAYYKKSFPLLAEEIRLRHQRYNTIVEKIETNDFPARLRVIQPQEKPIASRMTTNLKKIKASILQGYQDANLVLKRNS